MSNYSSAVEQSQSSKATSRKSRYTISDFAKFKNQKMKWAVLTSYDALTASLFDEAEIPMLLVGDSAGNNFLGEINTIPVTVDELIPLARAVVRGSQNAMVIADFPFGSYELSTDQALETGIRFMKEAGVHGVKLEGGVRVVEQVRRLVSSGIPVLGHIGLTPQSVHAVGGYKVQGRGDAAEKVIQDALALQEAGAFAVVLELVPAELAKVITDRLEIPTIGIGAGAECDAQVLVWTDLVGLTAKPPRFARRYLELRPLMIDAAKKWREDVASGQFPSEAETFH
jgi:3-methyl-2-oxobutanoate hydroxymethyltransferase